MRVEIAIAKGDPQSPSGWVVTPTIFMVVFTFEARWRIGWLFQMIAQLGWDHDDIGVLMTDVDLPAAMISRIRQVRDAIVPMQKFCLLENGLKLGDLTPAQIRARVG